MTTTQTPKPINIELKEAEKFNRIFARAVDVMTKAHTKQQRRLNDLKLAYSRGLFDGRLVIKDIQKIVKLYKLLDKIGDDE